MSAAKIAIVLALTSILLMLAVTGGPAPVPGTIAGHVVDSAGRAIPNADILIYGTTDAGQHANFEQRTDTRGWYLLRVPNGVYSARAYCNIVCNGKAYRLMLHPSDNDNTMSYDSRRGIIKDFVWRLTGLKAWRNLNLQRPESYYGGNIAIVLRDPRRAGLDGYATFPSGTVLEILLSPASPLLDGTAAKPLMMESRTPWQSPEQQILKDIPAAHYTATARARLPGNTIRPLRVAAALREGSPSTAPASSVEIDFQPSTLLGPSSDGFETITLYVMF